MKHQSLGTQYHSLVAFKASRLIKRLLLLLLTRSKVAIQLLATQSWSFWACSQFLRSNTDTTYYVCQLFIKVATVFLISTNLALTIHVKIKKYFLLMVLKTLIYWCFFRAGIAPIGNTMLLLLYLLTLVGAHRSPPEHLLEVLRNVFKRQLCRVLMSSL